MKALDISTDAKKIEIKKLFESFDKKGDIYEFLQCTGNSRNVKIVNDLCKSINFDCGYYKQKKAKEYFCLNCGKKLHRKQKFCTAECSNRYKHKERYAEFLENSKKYCRNNYSPRSFKKDILEEQDNKCSICGCEPFHNGKELIFILDHIDGDASNNKRENLRCICPNCDSQLDTYKSKNKHSTRRDYYKENIIKETLLRYNINNDVKTQK